MSAILFVLLYAVVIAGAATVPAYLTVLAVRIRRSELAARARRKGGTSHHGHAS